MKQMKVLTVVKTKRSGDLTFNLMSNGKVHINNHRTNKSSMFGNCEFLAKSI